MVPKAELDRRIKRLKKWMSRRDVDVTLIQKESNMFYLSGTKNAFMLVVPFDEDPVLITKYAFGDALAERESPYELDVIRPYYGLSKEDVRNPKVVEYFAQRYGEGVRRVAVDFLQDSKQIELLRKKTRRGKKSVAILDVTDQMTRMRLVKSDYEVEMIRKSADVAIRAFESLEIEEGMTERQIANRLTFEMVELGASGPSFPPIVAIGENSFNAHHVVTDKKLSDGQILLMDFGAVYEGYCSDMTRTMFFGRPDEEFLVRYDAVREAQEKALTYIRDGQRIEKPDIEARKVLKEAGLLEYYVHTLGHGIGIDIHEPPRLVVGARGKLLEGMAVTDEPGVYLKGWGGIRIEDTVVVGRREAKVITEALPKDPLMLRK